MQSEPQTCPECGAPIPPDAPRGLCPKCLLAGAAMTTESGPTNPGHPRPPAPTLAEIAAAFPQMEILDLIGRGGMGFVYRARQPKLERDVAIKVLPRGFANDPRFSERFVREARLLARLNHPNIVTIYDFGEADGFFYLIMELVDGVNLRQAMRASRFTPSQALAIVPAICEALQFAHDEGVLHRDIKPENILLDAKGRVKIADFGIAKLMTDDPTKPPPSGEAGETASGERAQQPPFGALTENQALGTPQYMAPEQIARPAEVDHRADIYSLGVVFYELLTGELPVGEFARPSSRTPLDERVDKIVLRALEKERELRQQSAREFKTQVETAAQSTNVGTAVHSTPEHAQASEQSPNTGRFNNWRVACALGVVMFYTGLVLGVPMVEMLHVADQGMLPLVMLVMIGTIIFLTSGLGFGSMPRTVSQENRATSCIPTFAIVGVIMCLPVCLLGLFFLAALCQELLGSAGGWRPNLAEAVLAPLAILGTFLLPLSCLRLVRHLRQWSSDKQATEIGKPPFLVPLCLSAMLVLTYWGLMGRPITVTVGAQFFSRVVSLSGVLPNLFYPSAYLVLSMSLGALFALFVYGWRNIERFKSLFGSGRDWLLVFGLILAIIGAVGLFRIGIKFVPFHPASSIIVILNTQPLLLVPAVALIALDNRWRRLAIGVLIFQLLSNLISSTWFVASLVSNNAQLGLRSLDIFRLTFTLAAFLPLWLLLHPNNRTRFGLRGFARPAWMWKHPRAVLAGLLFILLFDFGTHLVAPIVPVGNENPNETRTHISPDVSPGKMATLAPVVVETFPVSGARDVAPGRTELRVRFSKEMMDESWSWSTAWEGSTPESAGQPTYDESRRTCSLPVELEPGRTYAYWLNSAKFSGFQDTQGQPAVPYLLIFQTSATNRNDQPQRLTTDY